MSMLAAIKHTLLQHTQFRFEFIYLYTKVHAAYYTYSDLLLGIFLGIIVQQSYYFLMMLLIFIQPVHWSCFIVIPTVRNE